MEIKRVSLLDFEQVLTIYKDAIANMQVNRIFQLDELYPNEAILQEDILKEQLYAGMVHHEMASVFVLNKAFDPEYLQAQWEYTGDAFIVLHRICVRVAFQHKGIGTKTMEMIEEKMKHEGLQAIRLDAFSENPYALQMYHTLGYKKVGEARWRKGLFYILEKRLEKE
ncbi:MAG: GNAT family N-acetyltransferase [Treponema sp.]|jgi:ribosomal protein S18 acetylase RimI-like enzyme|nr:GNAT family N-acetyltransferase [Treponema sp.]